MHLYTEPKSHRLWPALYIGGKIHGYAGGKCPRVHLYPIDAPTFTGVHLNPVFFIYADASVGSLRSGIHVPL